jgi:ribosomal protein L30/L7E
MLFWSRSKIKGMIHVVSEQRICVLFGADENQTNDSSCSGADQRSKSKEGLTSLWNNLAVLFWGRSKIKGMIQVVSDQLICVVLGQIKDQRNDSCCSVN